MFKELIFITKEVDNSKQVLVYLDSEFNFTINRIKIFEVKVLKIRSLDEIYLLHKKPSILIGNFEFYIIVKGLVYQYLPESEIEIKLWKYLFKEFIKRNINDIAN